MTAFSTFKLKNLQHKVAAFNKPLQTTIGSEGIFVLLLGCSFVCLLFAMAVILKNVYFPIYWIPIWVVITMTIVLIFKQFENIRIENGQLVLLYFGVGIMANTIFLQYKNDFSENFIFFYWTMAVSVSLGISNFRYLFQVWAIPLTLVLLAVSLSNIPDEEKTRFYLWNPVITIMSFLGVYSSMKTQKAAKEYESKAKKYEFEFENLMNTMSNMVIIKDNRNKIIRVNQQYADLSNQQIHELINRNLYDFLPKEIAAKYHQEDLEIINTKEPKLQVLEEVMPLNSTKKIWIRADKFPYYDQEGNIQGVILFGTDVTKEIEANMEKLRSEAHFEQVFAEAPYGIVILDVHNNIIEANKTFQKMLGYERYSLTSRNIQEFVYTNSETFETLDNVFQKELEFSTKKGDKFTAQLTVSNVNNQDKQLNYRIGIVEDITAKKAAESQLKAYSDALKASNHDLEQFAYIASHDLREPLRMVNSYVTLLAKMYSHKLDSQGLEFISFASDGVKRMNDLIRDLLEYSRIGRSELKKDVIIFDNIIIKVLNNLRFPINEKKVEIDINADLPPFIGNQTQIAMVFQNLISNSIKYNQNKPLITIEGTLKNNFIHFEVRDNGIGMQEKHLDNIFQIFQRLHGREQYEGTGIGLAICKRIVNHHGGEISVTSKEGVGSSFFFTLPYKIMD